MGRQLIDSRQMIVIGGGAAGVFCAVNAARMGLRVIVLEKTGRLLSKVKVSGGGRCNVTHACFDIGEMAKRYPRGGHFVRKTAHRWSAGDTIGWFAERGVQLKTGEDGRMFPVTDSSQTVIDCLLREAGRWGVEFRLHAEVKAVSPRSGGFMVRLADGREIAGDYVCIACGGYPKSPLFDWIRALGHTVEEPVPSLFTFNVPGNEITRLMGVSTEAQVRIAGTRLVEKGPVLITHWGLSGPAILRLSAWGARDLAQMGYAFSVVVNWIPGLDEQQLRVRLQELRFEWGARKLGSAAPFGVPKRLWEYVLDSLGAFRDIRWADLAARDQNRLAGALGAATFTVKGKTTFKEEFVTAGGVRLTEVEPGTCESRKIPGLFFAGEILDVDGITGGFNFQHAWTSGWIAADTAARR
ncbi:MAG TPA: NAD(P)/FAD-dependent oxidoreductase [Bryobacteraceae bacterium]|nr:NAD(P)/FAD-dependent oxidoreductase [Bryobacteraceae bacterium]